MENQHKKANNLRGQTSPYLLQHLYNPVDWHPWGDHALEKARSQNKPLLVSIGYSACHWCHVMENESFEDQEVARLMNMHFVCIKVDREERPDIDHLYMNAVQLIAGQGGWPLNCFAMPDGRPFWGGTYFPKENWKDILIRVSELYKNQFAQVSEQANNLTHGVAQSSIVEPGGGPPLFSRQLPLQMYTGMMKNADSQEGGRKGAPKFPMPVNYEFLLNYFYHTKDQKALDHVILSLSKMAMGGIYDQVAGGFSRYSTDEHWKVPHFEKMLYDNAQLISLYSLAWKAKPDKLFKDVVYQTIDFIANELTSDRGVFYSALDADSEGEEGKYYVWTESELDEVLGDDALLIKTFFNVGGKGLWEDGKNILLRTHTNEEFASLHGLELQQWEMILKSGSRKLLERRSKRIPPALDNKVLVSWNALMIKALADAWGAFGEKEFLDEATKAADFILQHAMEPSGKLYRSLKSDVPAIDAFLEDYAMLIRALISLYEVTMDGKYLQKAMLLTQRVLEDFESGKSALFPFSSSKGETLVAPFYEFTDNVIPSSNSMMACNLFYLANYFEKPEWSQRSAMMLRDMTIHLEQYSSQYSLWGVLLLQHVYPFFTLAVCGSQAQQVMKEVNCSFIPHVLLAAASEKDESIPLLRGRHREGKTWFYLCHLGNCHLPVESFEEIKKQIKSARS